MSNANGGPPGTKKTVGNGVAKKRLAQLLANATMPQPVPKQAVATKEGEPQKVSSKKALRWAIKKYGEETANQMAAAFGKSLKRWAVVEYALWHAEQARATARILDPNTSHALPGVGETMPQRPNRPSGDAPLSTKDFGKLNDAMEAVVSGATKRSTRNRDMAKQVKQSRADRLDAMYAKRAEESAQPSEESVINALKNLGGDLAQNALRTFIDGSIKAMLTAFVALYVSRKTEGDSDEAVLALDACRQAFDACGLVLSDVETRAVKSAAVAIQAPVQPPPKRSNVAATEAPVKVVAPAKASGGRKPLTEEQRQAKRKKDRDRLAAKKAAKK